MQNSQSDYRVILGESTLEKVENYAARINQGANSGAELAAALIGINEKELNKWQVLSALINTKRPQIFAESQIAGDGTDWTLGELSILGDVSIGMTVSIYDNGAHQNPEIYDAPFIGHLIYTAGALLRNDRGHIPADWDAITVGNDYNEDKYFSLYERRLLPVFQYINDLSIQRGAPAFITIPGIGCGQFAGPFRGQMGSLFRAAIVYLLNKHGDTFSEIKAVYYDPYSECENENQIINGIQFIVRPLQSDNLGKSQLCRPSFLGQDTDGDFDDCELYSLVAWDHVSWPGNDYYLGARMTDDGVKAAATDTMKIMTGIKGHYSKEKRRYLPPKPYRNWNEVVAKNDLKIRVNGNCYIV